MFNDISSINSLNSTFINTQETLNGTSNLAQQDFQTPSHFVIEEIFATLPTTTQKLFPLFTQHLRYQKKN